MFKTFAVALLVLVGFTGVAVADDPPPYVSQWGSYGSGNGQFLAPWGVAIDSDRNIYVVDRSNNRIEKFDAAGNYLLQWGNLGSGNGQFNQATFVAVYGDNVYVSDFGNNRIQKFSRSGEYLDKWGSFGTGPGQFSTLRGVAVDDDGNVYAADADRIQKFTSNGTYLLEWGSTGTGNGQFDAAAALACDASGNVYVTDGHNNRVQKFTSTGTYISQWGSTGSGNGLFQNPWSISVATNGNVYVADAGNARIQIFDQAGNYLTQWGSFGTGDGQFELPFGMVVDGLGNVFVSDASLHRIQRFGSTSVYTITATAGSNGSITPNGVISVESGANQIFEINPNPGYEVASLVVDGISVTVASSYEFTNVTANHTIVASFTVAPPAFTIVEMKAGQFHYNPILNAELTVKLHSNTASGSVEVSPTLTVLPTYAHPTVSPQTANLIPGEDTEITFTWLTPNTLNRQLYISGAVEVNGGVYGTVAKDFSHLAVVDEKTDAQILQLQAEATGCGTSSLEACLDSPIDQLVGLIPVLGTFDAATGLVDTECLALYYEAHNRPVPAKLTWLVLAVEGYEVAHGVWTDAICVATGVGCAFKASDLVPSFISVPLTCITALTDGFQGNMTTDTRNTPAKLSMMNTVVVWEDSLQSAFADAGVVLSDLALTAGNASLRIEADSTFSTADSIGLEGVVVLPFGGIEGAFIKPGTSRLFGEGSNTTSAVTIRLLADTTGTNTFVLFHRQVSGEVIKLEYAPFMLDSGGVATIEVSEDSTVFALSIDQNGDGFVDWTHYPGGAIVSVPETGIELMQFQLGPVMPNPFISSTAIHFTQPTAGRVTLGAYDVAGRRLKHWQWETLPAGQQRVVWDGRTDAGTRINAGVVFLRLEVNGSQRTTKTILLK